MVIVVHARGLTIGGSNNCNFQLQDLEKRGKKRSIIPADELFLTLSRLRANVPEKVLADQFKISISEVSRIFVTWVDHLFSRLNQLPVWATRETVNQQCLKVSNMTTHTQESFFTAQKSLLRSRLASESRQRLILLTSHITLPKVSLELLQMEQ